MRRHYANYFRGLPHFKEHRLTLVTEDAPSVLHATLDNVAATYGDTILPA